ncbi:hypothetical protein, partial [Acidithiobacillus caldus]|uniref:hypothetical protein n=1 Tax=Acidithiobacillus caldus TaxID=33059 RepID=UPI001C06D8B0
DPLDQSTEQFIGRVLLLALRISHVKISDAANHRGYRENGSMIGTACISLEMSCAVGMVLFAILKSCSSNGEDCA